MHPFAAILPRLRVGFRVQRERDRENLGKRNNAKDFFQSVGPSISPFVGHSINPSIGVSVDPLIDPLHTKSRKGSTQAFDFERLYQMLSKAESLESLESLEYRFNL